MKEVKGCQFGSVLYLAELINHSMFSWTNYAALPSQYLYRIWDEQVCLKFFIHIISDLKEKLVILCRKYIKEYMRYHMDFHWVFFWSSVFQMDFLQSLLPLVTSLPCYVFCICIGWQQINISNTNQLSWAINYINIGPTWLNWGRWGETTFPEAIPSRARQINFNTGQVDRGGGRDIIYSILQIGQSCISCSQCWDNFTDKLYIWSCRPDITTKHEPCSFGLSPRF